MCLGDGLVGVEGIWHFTANEVATWKQAKPNCSWYICIKMIFFCDLEIQDQKEFEVEKGGAKSQTSDQKGWDQVLASEWGPALGCRGSVHWKLAGGEPQTQAGHATTSKVGEENWLLYQSQLVSWLPCGCGLFLKGLDCRTRKQSWWQGSPLKADSRHPSSQEAASRQTAPTGTRLHHQNCWKLLRYYVWMWELDYKESWVPKNWCLF